MTLELSGRSFPSRASWKVAIEQISLAKGLIGTPSLSLDFGTAVEALCG